MRWAWVIGGALAAGLGLFLLAVAAAPGLLGGSSAMSGGAVASSCAHQVHAASGAQMPPADADRAFAYREGEVHTLTFPGGRYYATLEHAGGDLVFLRARPPLDPDGPCAEAPFAFQVRAMGDGEARFRVWLSDG